MVEAFKKYFANVKIESFEDLFTAIFGIFSVAFDYLFATEFGVATTAAAE